MEATDKTDKKEVLLIKELKVEFDPFIFLNSHEEKGYLFPGFSGLIILWDNHQAELAKLPPRWILSPNQLWEYNEHPVVDPRYPGLPCLSVPNKKLSYSKNSQSQIQPGHMIILAKNF